MRLFSAVVALSLALSFSAALAQDLPQTPLSEHAGKENVYPKIVLYSVSWCPHCKAAKEYFTSNNIPFINRDVEIDSDALQLLTKKYKSQGVPVIVIGDDAEVIRGFDQARVEKALEKYQKK
jgi:glutaredoxin 3